MADPYGTEEEQLKALKQWWDRNGASTLIGVGLAIALVFGWQWWQQRQQDRATSAALLYQQLIQAVELAAADEVQRVTAEHLATTLAAEHAGSRYGQYGQLMFARMLVETGKPEQAEQVLRALLTAPVENSSALSWLPGFRSAVSLPEIRQLARLRLARVLFAADRSDEALELAASDDVGALGSQYAELRGDLLLGRDDLQGALSAYEQALQLAAETGSPASGLLRIKYESLAGAMRPQQGTDADVDTGAES